MKAFQSGMQKYEEDGAKVFAISTDNGPSQKAFAQQLSLSFPLLSDFVDRHEFVKYAVIEHDPQPTQRLRAQDLLDAVRRVGVR